MRKSFTLGHLLKVSVADTVCLRTFSRMFVEQPTGITEAFARLAKGAAGGRSGGNYHAREEPFLLPC